MTWEEQLYALKALDPDIALMMRLPGSWYVSANMEISEGCMLSGQYGEGSSPESAVQMHWQTFSTAPRVKAKGRYYRWDICMWRDLTEEVKGKVTP